MPAGCKRAPPRPVPSGCRRALRSRSCIRHLPVRSAVDVSVFHAHGEALILASLNRYLSTLDLWLVLMTAAVALASLGACPPRGRQRFLYGAAAGLSAVVLLFFSGFPDASVLHHRQLYAQSDRAKVDAAIAEKGIPAGERYILVGMQDGGRAYYIFQYLLDPAFLSLNLEDWRPGGRDSDLRSQTAGAGLY